MNLPAIWAYAAGITTGLFYPIAREHWVKKGEKRLLLSTVMLAVMQLAAWPIFALALCLRVDVNKDLP